MVDMMRGSSATLRHRGIRTWSAGCKAHYGNDDDDGIVLLHMQAECTCKLDESFKLAKDTKGFTCCHLAAGP
jgi:hypothetical protein